MSETSWAGPTPAASAGLENEPPARVNKVVFGGSALIVLAIAIWAILVPKSAEGTIATMVGWTSEWFGWFYVLLATAVLVFVLFLGFVAWGLYSPSERTIKSQLVGQPVHALAIGVLVLHVTRGRVQLLQERAERRSAAGEQGLRRPCQPPCRYPQRTVRHSGASCRHRRQRWGSTRRWCRRQ